MIKKSAEELNSQKSKHKGFKGVFETILRRFKGLGYLVLLSPLFFGSVLILGIALTPSAFLFFTIQELTAQSSMLIKSLGLGISISLGYFVYGLVVIFVVPIFNLPLIPLVKRYRGPWFSLAVMPWYMHNALIYLVRYTILDFLVPMPIGNLFYRMMGMKMGKGCMINSTNISDACLIELGDYVTIGGSATLMAHYGMSGYLIIDKLKIGRGSSIGLNANILGGVTIGKKAVVGPGATVLPKTIIKDGEKYGIEEQEVAEHPKK